LILLLIEALGDINFALDGTYSQRRNAVYCIVTLISMTYLLVAFSVVYDKRQHETSSQNLELLGATEILEKLITMKEFDGFSVTTDQHPGVNHMIADLQQKKQFRHHIDLWHKLSKIKKGFRAVCPASFQLKKLQII
jgi:hypothetical protein